MSIDGWSQGGTGYNGVPLIVISGSSAGTGSDGLDLDTGSDGTTIVTRATLGEGLRSTSDGDQQRDRG